jgi:coproporphyrinogen III oxidase-like Fe-S oxidoreductase
MGLRLKEGIKNEVFQKHFGKNISEVFDSVKLEHLIQNQLIEINQNHIKIPEKSLILANSIISKIVDSLSD